VPTLTLKTVLQELDKWHQLLSSTGEEAQASRFEAARKDRLAAGTARANEQITGPVTTVATVPVSNSESCRSRNQLVTRCCAEWTATWRHLKRMCTNDPDGPAQRTACEPPWTATGSLLADRPVPPMDRSCNRSVDSPHQWLRKRFKR
jgi:hypothetical protein